MRKLFYSMFAAIGALTMASCAVDNTVDGTHNGSKTVTVRTAIEQTRTTFDTDLHKLSWDAGDTFGLFEVNEAGEFVKHHANLPVEGTTLTLDANTAQLYAYYPSKEDISSFDDVTFWLAGVYNGFEGFEFEDCTPLAAKASVESGSINLLFKPTVAIVELNIYGGEEGAVLHGYDFHSDEDCSSYTATIDWDNLTLNVDMQEMSSMTEEDNEPVVDGDKEHGAKVYFTVPKGVYHNAVITLHHEGGEGSSTFEFDELNLTYFGRTINLNLGSGEAEEDYYLHFHKAVIEDIDDTWGISWVQPYQSEPEVIDEIVLLYDAYEKEYTYVIGVESNFEWSIVEEDSTIAGFVSVSKLNSGSWLRINIPYDSASRRLGTTDTLYLVNNDTDDTTTYALDIIFPEAEATIELLGQTASLATFKKMTDSETAYYKEAENAAEFFVTDKTIFYELEISDSSKEYYFTTSEPFIVDMSDNEDFYNNPHFETVSPFFLQAVFTADNYDGLEWTLSFKDMEKFEESPDNIISLYHFTDTGVESVFIIHITMKEAEEKGEYYLSGLGSQTIEKYYTWKQLTEEDADELISEELGAEFMNGTKVYKLTFTHDPSGMASYAQSFKGHLPLGFIFAAPYDNTPWINVEDIKEDALGSTEDNTYYYTIPFDFKKVTKESRKGTISFYEGGTSSHPDVALIVDFKYIEGPVAAGDLTFTHSIKTNSTGATITITPSDEATQYAFVAGVDNGYYGKYPYNGFFGQFEQNVDWRLDIFSGVLEHTLNAGSASVGFFGVANCNSDGEISGEWTKYFFNFSDGSEYIPEEGETKWDITVNELDTDWYSFDITPTPNCQYDAGWALAEDMKDGWDSYASKNGKYKPGDAKPSWGLKTGTTTTHNMIAKPNTEYVIWVLPVVDGDVFGEPVFHYFTFNGGGDNGGDNGGGEEEEAPRFSFEFSSTAADKVSCTVSAGPNDQFTNYYGVIVRKADVDDYNSVKDYMLAKGEVKPGEQYDFSIDLEYGTTKFDYSGAYTDDFYVCIVVPTDSNLYYEDPIVSEPYEHVYNN